MSNTLVHRSSSCFTIYFFEMLSHSCPENLKHHAKQIPPYCPIHLHQWSLSLMMLRYGFRLRACRFGHLRFPVFWSSLPSTKSPLSLTYWHRYWIAVHEHTDSGFPVLGFLLLIRGRCLCMPLSSRLRYSRAAY